MSHVRSFVAAAVALFACSMAGGALAEPIGAEAAKHLEAGEVFMKFEDYEKALPEIEASVEAEASKEGLLALARCSAELGKPTAARRALERLEAEFGDALDDGDRDEIEKLEGEIVEGFARLEVEVNEDGARILVDMVDMGRAPLDGEILLDPGEHGVAVSLKGHRTVKRTVNVGAGFTKIESFVLIPMETEEAPPDEEIPTVEPFTEEGEAGPSEDEAEEVEEGEGPQEVEEEREPMNGMTIGAIASWAVGGASLVASVVLGGVCWSSYGDLEDDCPDGVCDDPDRLDDAETGQSVAVAADVLLAAGLVGAALGGVLFWLGLEDEEPQESGPDAGAEVEVGLAPAPLGAGAVLTIGGEL